MARVVITISDEGEGGEVAVHLDFGKGFDPASEAHTLAAEIAMELKEGKQND